jgi:adenylate kinase
VATPVRLVLLGPPGSGKGTQGSVIAGRLGVPYVSTGDVLRADVAAGTELGRRVSAVIDRGELVPDDLMVSVVAAALEHHGQAPGDGYVLDGFPRTLTQAIVLERPDSSLEPPDVAVLISLPDHVVHARLRRRAEEGRTDDADTAVIERRLEVYREESGPLIEHYRSRAVLLTVDGDQPPPEVTGAILAALAAHRDGG